VRLFFLACLSSDDWLPDERRRAYAITGKPLKVLEIHTDWCSTIPPHERCIRIVLSLAIRATALLALECGDLLPESLILGFQTMPLGRLLLNAPGLSVDELLVEVVKGFFVVILIVDRLLEGIPEGRLDG